jgi:hypothetical protein
VIAAFAENGRHRTCFRGCPGDHQEISTGKRLDGRFARLRDSNLQVNGSNFAILALDLGHEITSDWLNQQRLKGELPK